MAEPSSNSTSVSGPTNVSEETNKETTTTKPVTESDAASIPVSSASNAEESVKEAEVKEPENTPSETPQGQKRTIEAAEDEDEDTKKKRRKGIIYINGI